MANNLKASITDATGASATIAADQRCEVWIRNAGTNTIYLALNETATDATGGFYLESGDALILSGKSASAAIHMVCASGETATVWYQLVG